jgi:hypothetical protein
MNLKYELIPENLKIIEIKQIFLDKEKFGALTFDKSYETAHNTRKMLVELQELGYKDKLTLNEINQINNDITRFLQLVNEVFSKNPETDPNFNINVRNSLDDNIINTCQDIQIRLREKLVYLRQELELSKPENRDLQEEQKELTKIRTEYEKTLSDLQKKIEALTSEKTTIENTQGEIAATKFGKHFENQVEEYEGTAKEWLLKRNKILVILEIVISVNFLAYIIIFIGWKVGQWPDFPPSSFFTIDYAVIKISGILLLSYILSFNSKNYSINKNLSAKNKHRKNVAETVSSFLGSPLDQESKSHILKEGAEAMFKDGGTGYLGKMNEKDHSPIEQITYIMPNKKE